MPPKVCSSQSGGQQRRRKPNNTKVDNLNWLLDDDEAFIAPSGSKSAKMSNKTDQPTSSGVSQHRPVIVVESASMFENGSDMDDDWESGDEDLNNEGKKTAKNQPKVVASASRDRNVEEGMVQDSTQMAFVGAFESEDEDVGNKKGKKKAKAAPKTKEKAKKLPAKLRGPALKKAVYRKSVKDQLDEGIAIATTIRATVGLPTNAPTQTTSRGSRATPTDSQLLSEDEANAMDPNGPKIDDTSKNFLFYRHFEPQWSLSEERTHYERLFRKCKYCRKVIEDNDEWLIAHLHENHALQFDSFTADRFDQMLYYLNNAKKALKEKDREIRQKDALILQKDDLIRRLYDIAQN